MIVSILRISVREFGKFYIQQNFLWIEKHSDAKINFFVSSSLPIRLRNICLYLGLRWFNDLENMTLAPGILRETCFHHFSNEISILCKLVNIFDHFVEGSSARSIGQVQYRNSQLKKNRHS